MNLKRLITIIINIILILTTVTACTKENNEEIFGGKYIEEDYKMPQEMIDYDNFFMFKNNDLGILKYGEGNSINYFISKDEGDTWEKKEGKFEENVKDDTEGRNNRYETIQPDGSLLINYKAILKNQPDIDSNISIWQYVSINLDGTIAPLKTFNNITDFKIYGENIFAFNQKIIDGALVTYAVVRLDKKTGEVLKEYTLEDDDLQYFYVNDTNIFLQGKNNIAKFDLETGKEIKRYILDGNYFNIYFDENELMLIEAKKITKYNFEKDTVSTYAIKLNLQSLMRGDFYEGRVLFSKNEDVIYITNRQGLFRYVLGTSIVEQIINGEGTAFGNGDLVVVDIFEKGNNQFLVSFKDQYNFKPLIKSYKFTTIKK